MKARRQNPGDPDVPQAQAEVQWRRAEWLRGAGQPADRAIQAGLDRTGEALAVNPRHARTLALQGRLLLLKAQGTADSGPRAELERRGRESLRQAFGLNPLLTREYSEPAGR